MFLSLGDGAGGDGELGVVFIGTIASDAIVQ